MSEISFFDKVVDSKDIYAQIFTCKVGAFPFKYLEVPMHVKKLASSDWKETEDKIQKKTACWKGCLNSIGSRLILIESGLNIVPSYMMSIFRMPMALFEC